MELHSKKSAFLGKRYKDKSIDPIGHEKTKEQDTVVGCNLDHESNSGN